MAETRVTVTTSWQSVVSGPKTVVLENQSQGMMQYALESSAPGASVLGIRLKPVEKSLVVVPAGFNLYAKTNDVNGTPVLVAIDETGVAGLPSSGASVAVSLTRTADTNAYLASDVVGAATGASAALTFAAVGPASGQILVTTAELEIDASAIISGETSYRLYLYNVTPPSALGDNAAWDLPSGDRASFLGYIDLGTPVDLGSTLYVRTDGINAHFAVPASGSLFGYLVTNGAHTPTSARVYKITLHSVAI